MTGDATKGRSELILYQTEDGRTRIQCHSEGKTVWLTQAQMAEPFQTTPQNITLHLKDILVEGELDEEATCKSYSQVRQGRRPARHAEPIFSTNATPEGERSIKVFSLLPTGIYEKTQGWGY